LKGIMKKSGAQYEKWMKKIEADMKKNWGWYEKVETGIF
jgi:hypothetical protein